MLSSEVTSNFQQKGNSTLSRYVTAAWAASTDVKGDGDLCTIVFETKQEVQNPGSFILEEIEFFNAELKEIPVAPDDLTLLGSQVVGSAPAPFPGSSNEPFRAGRGTGSGVPGTPEKKEPDSSPEPEETEGQQIHKPYLLGDETGAFLPEQAISRAETAALFSRICAAYQNADWNPVEYEDVSSEDWYQNDVGFVSRKNWMNGDPDGSFRPNDPITRAEFTAVSARYLSLDEAGPAAFPDCAEHWAAGWISTLAGQNIVSGYEDGSFRPEADITRAEAVKIIHALSGRSPVCQGLHGIELRTLGLEIQLPDSLFDISVESGEIEYHKKEHSIFVTGSVISKADEPVFTLRLTAKTEGKPDCGEISTISFISADHDVLKNKTGTMNKLTLYVDQSFTVHSVFDVNADIPIGGRWALNYCRDSA